MEKNLSPHRTPLLMSVCYLCRETNNTQLYRLPCECSVLAHPDCFAEYILRNRRKISGHWRLQCTQCLRVIVIPEHIAVEVNIPTESDDDRRERLRIARCDRIKLWVAVAVQCGMLIGLVLFLTFGYTAMTKQN